MIDLEFVGDYRQPRLSARARELGHDGTSAGDFTFGDFLDIINPLQHIPILSTFYREITGDEIGAPARIVGDTLFGGPIGFMSAVANVFYQEVAGEDVGETVLALFTGDGDAGEPQFAEGAEPAAPAEAAPGALPETLPAPLETAAAPSQAADPVAAAAEAVLPEPAAGMLTGQDALNALFMDLRGNRQNEAGLPLAKEPAAPLPLPGRGAGGGKAIKSYPLPPRHVRVPNPAAEAAARAPASPTAATLADTTAAEAATNPLLFAQETAGGAIAERMMQALDKYQAMARQGAAEQKKPAETPVRWQADPAVAGEGS